TPPPDGEAPPKPPPPVPPATIAVGRDIAAVNPAAHGAGASRTGGGLAEELMWYFQSGTPKAVSTAWTVSDAVPKDGVDLKPRTPIRRSSRIGSVSVVAAFGSYSSLSFHRNLKGPNAPGFCIVWSEMRGSLRIQPLRCASKPLVVHSTVPRPCAYTPAAQAAPATAIARDSATRLVVALVIAFIIAPPAMSW